jgi:hypothetical protein
MTVVAAQAAMVVNTGVDVSGGVDQAWGLASINPPITGNNPDNAAASSLPNAYVATPDTGFPFGQYWLPNNASPASLWITYATPLYTGGDIGRTFDYEQTFIATANATIDFRWLSDNDSYVYLNNTQIGYNGPANANNYATFNTWTYGSFNVAAGQMYTLDVDVDNIGQDSGNPTGMRFEATVVPEPTAIAAAALLLLLPLGASASRILHRNRQV